MWSRRLERCARRSKDQELPVWGFLHEDDRLAYAGHDYDEARAEPGDMRHGGSHVGPDE
jgi:hypothetical protein